MAFADSTGNLLITDYRNHLVRRVGATGSFGSPTLMGEGRYLHSVAWFEGGLLIAGGISEPPGNNVVSSAEIYVPPLDGDIASITTTGDMGTERFAHTATTLLDGKIFISGGRDGSGGGTPLASTELFDPLVGVNGGFIYAGSMSAARQEHTATLLDDGRVLICGGYGISGTLRSCEIYHPEP